MRTGFSCSIAHSTMVAKCASHFLLPTFPGLPGLRLLLAKPEFPVSTPWAYQRWVESRPLPGISYDPVRLAWGDVVNDLERPVFQKYPVLADMKRWLSSRTEVEAAAMSGSGSTMFAILNDSARSADLEASLKAEFGDSLWVALTRTVGSQARDL